MSGFLAALPMYDWPETRAETDARWAAIRDRLRAAGIDAPENLARRNADLPAVPGGIGDFDGNPIAPDPATLPPDGLDLFTLWRHPALLFSQTCWGPMDTGLFPHVRVIAQPRNYSQWQGGSGELYSSAVFVRGDGGHAPPPKDGRALLPLDLLREKRFAFNNSDSMSGLIGISRDLDAMGQSLDIFSERIETGSHRASALALARGRADVAAIDCRSWCLVRRFEPEAAAALQVVGWTARRMGLPFITAAATPDETVAAIKAALPG